MTFDVFATRVRGRVGDVPFTVLIYDEFGARPVFSSVPETYAARGYKTFAETPSMRSVREGSAPLLSDGLSALKRNFPDWEIIVGAGCDALLNLPLRGSEGKARGQVNFMWRAGCFTADVVRDLQALADQSAAELLAAVPATPPTEEHPEPLMPTPVQTVLAALPAAIVITDPDLIGRYMTDFRGKYTGRSAAVLKPRTTEEVSLCVHMPRPRDGDEPRKSGAERTRVKRQGASGSRLTRATSP